MQDFHEFTQFPSAYYTGVKKNVYMNILQMFANHKSKDFMHAIMK